MEPEGSLPHLQVPATCPYPEPDQFNPCPHPISWRSILILSSLPRLGLPSGLPLGYLTKTLYAPRLSPIRTTCLAHLILELITRIIFGEFWVLRPSLCNFPPSPVTLSLLGPNILLSTLFSNTLNQRSSLNLSYHVSHPYKNRQNYRSVCLNLYIFK